MSRPIVCDGCGENVHRYGDGNGPVAYKLTHESGARYSDLTFEDKDFCSIKCVSDWARKNWKREDDDE